MLELTRPVGGIALICCVSACGAAAQPQKRDAPKANADAVVLADFTQRIDAYMKMREKLKSEVPKLKETTDPAEIQASQDSLATKIRAARRDARPGDIFTTEIRARFRQVMYPELTGQEGRETKAAIKEDAPAPASVPFRVNARYPEGEPLPTMPPNLLASLPQLPPALEYRVVGRHLILRDVHANIIVDYIPDAIR